MKIDNGSRPWDTPGLPPRAKRCRYHAQCAFRDDDPSRCPVCHRTWTRIAECDCHACNPNGAPNNPTGWTWTGRNENHRHIWRPPEKITQP